jgi:hypothetical protein
MKKNKIKFIFTSEYGWNIEAARPTPASSNIPDWFKEMKPYDDDSGLRIVNGKPNITAKKCVPMLDSMTSGYILSLWSDVMVGQELGPEITWKVGKDIFSLHGESSRKIPPPPGYHQIVFKYDPLLTIETPKGYSLLVTPPMGYQDLPFKAVPAIIDADGPMVNFGFPVWIKKDLNGIVEKGTPMIQIIPFKRDSWTSEVDYIKEEQFSYMMDNGFNSTIKNHYMKNFWSKKDFK